MNNKCMVFNVLSKTTREQGSKFVHMTYVGSSSNCTARNLSYEAMTSDEMEMARKRCKEE